MKRKRKVKFVVCEKCGMRREHYARGLCRRCYRIENPEKKKIGLCLQCVQEMDFGMKEIHALGLCEKHYKRRWRERRPNDVV